MRALIASRCGAQWLMLCLLWASAGVSAAPIIVDSSNENLLLGNQIKVLADREGTFESEDVLAGRHDNARVTSTRSPPNMGYPKHPYWAVLELRNDSTASIERLLVLWRGSTHRQQALISTRIDDQAASPAQHSTAQDVLARHSIIRLTLPARSTTRIAVRIETYTALSLDYRLLTDIQLASIDRVDYWFFGLLAGIVSAIGIYVLALFYAIRERLYLLFGMFAVGNIIYQVHTEGYAYLVWPEHLRPWGNAAGTLGGALFSLMIVQFIRDYMDLPKLTPRMDRWLMQPVLLIMLSVFVLYPLAPWLGNTVAAVGVISGTVAASIAALRGSMISRPVWSFLGAVLVFFVMGVAHLLKRMGVLPDLQSLALLLQIGSAGTTMAFAIAVMVRVRRMVELQRAAQLDYADQLEHKVNQRTSQLLEAKESAERALAELKATRRQLLEADKMASLGQLVAGVSHEVNTPLGVAVTASSHLAERSRILQNQLAKDALSRSDLEAYLDETRDAGAMIERNLERAAHLIRSFKQVSVDRTSDGRRRFELATQISELIDSLRVSWKRRPVTLSVECPSGIELDSFPGALGQVLTNLIQNALLHAFDPEEPGEMRITAKNMDASTVEIVFEDNGKGMTQVTLARIFDPFFTTKRNQGGTGLGLNIVYNLVVQKLGGEIEAASNPGKGLRLCIRLPKHAPTGAVEVADD